MNRRNFFTMAAQFVLGCAIGIKASREIETAPVFTDKALFGTWRFIVPAKEMTYWSFQDDGIFPYNMGETIDPNWVPNPDWVNAQPDEVMIFTCTKMKP